MAVIYTAYQTNVVRADFVCGKCAFTSPVEITAVGAGQTQSSTFGDDQATAAAQAQEGAAEGAARWADVYFELFPCPKCGWRNPQRVASFKRGAWISAAITAGLFAIGAALVLVELAIAGAIVAFFGLIMVIVTPAMLLSMWYAPKKQVKLLPADHTKP